MNDWNHIQRLRDVAPGAFEAKLLNSARFDAPEMGARQKLLFSLGLTSGALAISGGAKAASSSVAPPSSTAGAGLAGTSAAAAGTGAMGIAAASGSTFGGATPYVLAGAKSPAAVFGAAGAVGAGVGTIGALARTGAVGFGAFGKSSAGWLGGGVVAKWLSIGLVAGAAVSAAVLEVARSAGGSSSLETPSAQVVSARSGGTRIGESSEPEFLALDVPATEQATAEASEPPAPAPRARVSRGAKAQAGKAVARSHGASRKKAKARTSDATLNLDDTSLGSEIALIDRARYALREGRADDAMKELRLHRRHFEAPTLKPEAEILRIEALIVQGKRGLAGQKARAFLNKYPISPHRDRVLQLLGEAEGS